MKAETYKDHRARVDRCVRALENSQDQRITLAALARTACLSKYHFGRVFAELAGETPVSMARRLRLENAHRLLRTKHPLSVANAADRAGFASQQAFARRFKRQFGLSPSMTRSQPTSDLVGPRPVQLAARRAISVPFDGRYGDLSEAFGGLLGRVHRLIKQPDFDVLFLSTTCFDTQPDDRCQGHMLVSASALNRTAVGLPRVVLPAGWFMMFPGRGAFKACAAALARSIDRAIAAHGGTRRPGAVMRRFLNDPALVPTRDQRWEIYVPIDRPSPNTHA